MKIQLRYKGGAGSGNKGHKGIPGHLGGSAPSSGSGGSGMDYQHEALNAAKRQDRVRDTIGGVNAPKYDMSRNTYDYGKYVGGQDRTGESSTDKIKFSANGEKMLASVLPYLQYYHNNEVKEWLMAGEVDYSDFKYFIDNIDKFIADPYK